MKLTIRGGKVVAANDAPNPAQTQTQTLEPEPAPSPPTTVAEPVATEPAAPKPAAAKPIFNISTAIAQTLENTPVVSEPAGGPTEPAKPKGKKEEPPLPATVQTLVDAIASTPNAVQQELVDEEGNAVTVTVQQRNRQALFELLRNHDVFEYPRMEISVGTVNTRLEFETLGVSEEQRDALRAVNAKGTPIEMFPALKNAGGEMRKLLDDVKKNMAYTGGAWICTDVQFPTVAVGLEKIEQECIALREKVVLSIPENKRAFLEGVAGVVIASNERLAREERELIDLEEVLLAYAGNFPTAADVRRWFRFEVDGPIYNPSLTKQAESNARLKEAMVRFESANLEQAQLAAVKRAFDERQRKLQDAVASGMDYVRNQVIQTYASIVSSLTNSVEKEKVHASTKNSVIKRIEDMKTMLAQPFVPKSFGDLLADAEKFNSMIQNDTWSAQQMRSQLDAALEKLKTEYQFQPPEAQTGHRAGYVPQRNKNKPVTQSEPSQSNAAA